MTQFTVAVAETTRCFGGAPTSLWNAYLWGAFKWGEGTASMVVGAFVGVIETEPATTTCDVQAVYQVAVDEACPSVGTMTSGQIRDTLGYYKVFPNDTTDGEERDTPTWTAGSPTTPSWTAAAATATSWSSS